MQPSNEIIKLLLIFQREKNAGSRCILSMKDKTTVITNPDTGDKKSFSFDHSYWSHDDFTETTEGIYEPNSPNSNYTDQVKYKTKMSIPDSYVHFSQLLICVR